MRLRSLTPSPALRRAPRRAVLVLIALALTTTGCFNPFDPLVFRERGVSSAAPVPSSPENTMQLFRWCWVNRAADVYEEVFTDDYVFVFATTDSAGNAFRDRPYTREDELITARNLFNGGGNEPPATSVTLNLDPTLRKSRDPRPGKANKWHWVIQTSVALTVRTESQSYETTGRGLYYFIRGDSAAIPPALQQRGFQPDSTRWWLERWEDQTVGSAGGLVAEALSKLGGERPVAIEMTIRPDGDWVQSDADAATPNAPPGAAAGRAPSAAGATGTSAQLVTFGWLKAAFRRV